MQENGEKDEVLQTLLALEDLAEKKAKIYSRLLTDATLAKDMEALALRHSKRKQTISGLINGKKGDKE